MTETVTRILVNVLYLLALINPVSKVSILSFISPQEQGRDFRLLATKSSLAAFGILLVSMVFGDMLLRSVFHVDLYALRLAGGVVLFWVGFNALRRGVFFEQTTHDKFSEMALVPLSCPMIAGPATIAACIALHASDGFVLPAVSLFIALGINHVIMLMSRPISTVLRRFNILGAIIRLTGLIVMTMGTQMALDGIAIWSGATAP